MDNLKKINVLKMLIQCTELNETRMLDILEKIDVIKHNYYDYMITEPINCDEELKRVVTADYDVCCAILTMLFRENHFSNGSFERRYNEGQVVPIFERLIQLLRDTDSTKMKSVKINSFTGYCSPDIAIEQHITIFSSGRVYFKQTKPYIKDAELTREIKHQIFIGKDKANEILNRIYNFYIDNHSYFIVMDGGNYEMVMTFEDGKKIKFDNSIAYEKDSIEHEVSDYIRDRIPLDNLMLFDGLDNEWDDVE